MQKIKNLECEPAKYRPSQEAEDCYKYAHFHTGEASKVIALHVFADKPSPLEVRNLAPVRTIRDQPIFLTPSESTGHKSVRPNITPT